jgi:glycosyltransferase 2 family protein
VSEEVESTIVVEAPIGGTVRSPSDLLRLVVGIALLLTLLLVQWLFGDTLTTFFGQVLGGLSALPDWIVDVVVVGTRLLAVIVLGGGLVLTLARGRFHFLFAILLAGVGASAVAWLLDRIGPESGRQVVQVTHAVALVGRAGFPTGPGVAAAAAIVTAAAPWTSRRWRRAGWVLVIGLATTRFLAAPVSFDAVRGVIVGWVVGALVVVLLGGPSRRPTGTAIADGLARVGVPLARLEQASVDARGSTPYFAETRDGQKLFVKALGEDQRSADLLFRLYRYATRHQLGDERPFSTLRRAVEHEALVALAARDAHVRTPRFVALATCAPNSFVLAYEAIEGRSLDRLDPSELTDDVLAAIWNQVRVLRAHRIAHRDLRLANVFLADDSAAWAIDFGFSELAASDLLLANDIAELTTSLASVVGSSRAVQCAVRTVGPAGLIPVIDRLHPWALSGATRSALKAQPHLLEDVRAAMSVASRGARADAR